VHAVNFVTRFFFLPDGRKTQSASIGIQERCYRSTGHAHPIESAVTCASIAPVPPSTFPCTVKTPLQYDERYAVTPDVVQHMRALRRSASRPSYQQIADSFGVSYHTAYYWINDGYRAYKRSQLAERRHTKSENKLRSRKWREKLKWRWQHVPATRIESDYHSLKYERRTRRISSRGRSAREVEEEYHRTKASDSRKID
jgi:hypothetical protein